MNYELDTCHAANVHCVLHMSREAAASCLNSLFLTGVACQSHLLPRYWHWAGHSHCTSEVTKCQKWQVKVIDPKLVQVISTDVEPELPLKQQVTTKQMDMVLDRLYVYIEPIPVIVFEEVLEVTKGFVYGLKALQLTLDHQD